MFALILNGKVVQVEAVIFDVAPALEWVDITGITPAPEFGWRYDGTNFTPPPSPLIVNRSKAALTADELATLLISKTTISRSEVDTIKTSR